MLMKLRSIYILPHIQLEQATGRGQVLPRTHPRFRGYPRLPHHFLVSG